jgi:hypothetical protein
MEIEVVNDRQRSGGVARAMALSSEERRAIAKRAALTRWAKIQDSTSLPRASRRGMLPIGDVDIEVYRLHDGRRLIAKNAMARALNLKSEDGNAFLRTVTRKRVRSAIGDILWEKNRKPHNFNRLDGDSESITAAADGYEATTLIEVCDALIQARNDSTRRVLFALARVGDLAFHFRPRVSSRDRLHRLRKPSGPTPFAPSLNVQRDNPHNNSGFSI